MPVITAASFPKFTKQRVSKSSSYTQTTATFTDVTEMTVTLPNRNSGLALVSFKIDCALNAISATGFQLQLVDNAVVVNVVEIGQSVANTEQLVTLDAVTTLSGQVVKLQASVIGGVNTLTVLGVAGKISYIDTLECSP